MMLACFGRVVIVCCLGTHLHDKELFGTLNTCKLLQVTNEAIALVL